MQDRNAGRSRREGAEPAGLSPVRAFFLLAAIGTAAGIGLFATRDASPAEPRAAVSPQESPDYALTDEKAIAEFERLNDQLMLAYRERSIALAEDVFTSDSPMLPRVRKEIQTLIRSSRVSATKFRTEETRVVENEPTQITINHVEVLRPRFETEDGEDATAAGRPHRQELEWSLRLQRSRWLLHSALIIDVEVLRGGQ